MLSNAARQTCRPPGFKLRSKGFSLHAARLRNRQATAPFHLSDHTHALPDQAWHVDTVFEEAFCDNVPVLISYLWW